MHKPLVLLHQLSLGKCSNVKEDLNKELLICQTNMFFSLRVKKFLKITNQEKQNYFWDRVKENSNNKNF